MRQDYSITISSLRDSRHFTFGRRAQRVIVGATAGLAFTLIGSALAIVLLSGQVDGLDQRATTLSADNLRIEADNQRLSAAATRLENELRKRRRELAALGTELSRIETLVGVQPQDDHSLAQRIDLAGRTAYERQLMLRSIPSGFPVGSGRVTSHYGMRQHPIHERESLHGGVDLRARRGTPIHATADGVVEWAAVHRESGLGNMVKLLHNYGFATIYGHLDEIAVDSGSYVKRGELLGYSGNTGQSAAPHLHYEVRYLQRRLDPSPFLRWSLEEFDVLFSEEDRVQWESLTEIVRTAASVPETPLLRQAPSLSATSP